MSSVSMIIYSLQSYANRLNAMEEFLASGGCDGILDAIEKHSADIGRLVYEAEDMAEEADTSYEQDNE